MGSFYHIHQSFFFCTGSIFVFLFLFEAHFVQVQVQAESESELRADENSIARAWTKETGPVEFSIFQTRDKNAPFDVQLDIFGAQYALKLRRPASTVFAPGFKIDGQSTRRDELEKIEEDIFIDTENMAVLQVFKDSNSTFCLRGWVNGAGIIARENCQLEAIQIRRRKPARGGHHDWCGVGRPRKGGGTRPRPKPKPKPPGFRPHKPDSTQTSQRPQNPQKPQISQRPQKPQRPQNPQKPQTSQRPQKPGPIARQTKPKRGKIEIQFLFDLESTADIQKNGFDLNTYAAILCKALNVVYSSLTDPQLQIVLVGARSLTEDEDQRLVKDVQSRIFKMLDVLKEFLSEEGDKNIQPHDTVALLSGRDTLDDEGRSGIAGLAGIGSACLPFSSSVCRGTGGAFEGTNTIAHEIGHNIGCNHDFELKEPRDECFPMKGDGRSFVMGYNGTTPNRYMFSTCSKDQIKDYTSGDGKCVFKLASSQQIDLDGVNFPGNSTTLTQQCTALLNPVLAGADKVIPNEEDYVENCFKINCAYTEAASGKNITLIYDRPSEGTKCLNDVRAGVCKNQGCVKGPGKVQAKSINDQCRQQIDDYYQGTFTAVPGDDKYVTCGVKSYNCDMKSQSGDPYVFGITPQDGSPCIFKNIYGSCRVGDCKCKPNCYT